MILRRILCSLILVVIFVMAGCSPQSQQGEKHTRQDRKTVVLAAYRHLAPGPKDAMYCSKILGVWEPLISKDNQGRPVPALATAWEMKQGGKEWIFHLRRQVVFHDGTPFNADAVLKNFDRMSLGYRKSSFYGLDIKNYYPGLIKYEKLDDYTIRLLFKEPNINELYKMTDFGSPIYAPQCFDEEGNFKGIALGTGPYRITENNIGKAVVLEAFPQYYGPKPKIKKYILRSIPNADVRYAALKAGEIDGVLDLNAIPPFLAVELLDNPHFAVASNNSTMTRFLHLNGSKFPFNDVRMRQAVSLAIDRRALVKALYLDYAYPTANILNCTSPYFVEFPVEYNVKKAQKLAKEVLGDKRLDIIYCINGKEILQKGEAELIAYWLKDIGLNITIQSLEYATMLKQLRRGDYHMARLQQGLPNGDPYSIFHTFMTPQGSRNLSSSSRYFNQEVVDLMEGVKHVEDEKERQAIYKRLQELSVMEQPIVPLFNDMNIVAYNKRLKNYQPLIYGVDLSKVEFAYNE